MQEEFRRNTRDGSSSKHDDEEDCTFAINVKKGKGNKFHSKYQSKGKKLDMFVTPFFGHLTCYY